VRATFARLRVTRTRRRRRHDRANNTGMRPTPRVLDLRLGRVAGPTNSVGPLFGTEVESSVGLMTQDLRTFLTFQGGAANAALELYADVFDDFEMISIAHHGPAGGGPEGTVMAAQFRLAGGEFSCADSPVDHEWGFTPAISLWIDCDNTEEQTRLFDRLAVGGQVFMPLDDYSFSTRFGWVGDAYGVTWQLNLP
jgi:predicted 3-demethylubiquinone-9 3-methyltransferase (glyoxalase superfamily)